MGKVERKSREFLSPLKSFTILQLTKTLFETLTPNPKYTNVNTQRC